MGKYFLFAAVIIIGYITFFSSCANIGMPSGGPRDTIPPVVIRTIPADNQTNVRGKEVRVSFNELIQLQAFNEKFVVSPPSSKRPLPRMKGRTLIIDLNDTLRRNTTYSLDFKDAIVDNNEGNRLPDFRLAFSTGPTVDSMRVVGFVKDAFTLEPAGNSSVLFYTGRSDTLIYTKRPDFIAKTDSRGFFAATNLPADTFMVYAISDADNNLKYTLGADSIAFLDSLIIPSAQYFPDRDTTVTGPDTLVVFGRTRFYPDPLYFLRFYEKGFDLRLDKYEHPARKYLDLVFTGSVRDTFNIVPLNFTPEKEWKYLEMSKDQDSIRVWLLDSTVYNMDTLTFKLNYLQLDSLENKFVTSDTVKFFFSDPLQKGRVRRRDRRKVEVTPQSFSLGSNIKQGFDIYSDIELISLEPIASFDTSKVNLFVLQDSVFLPVPYNIRPDSVNRRRYIISHKWNFGATYNLTIDSAAVRTIYDLPSNKFDNKFTVQEEEYYGKIIINIQNVTGPTIVQLLSDTKDEVVQRSRLVTTGGEVEFPYLEPKKYMLKAIFDANKNGIWDSGDLNKKIQPEEVVYYGSVIRVRANWDNRSDWALPLGKSFSKKIIDTEEEEEKLKQLKRRKTPPRSRAF